MQEGRESDVILRYPSWFHIWVWRTNPRNGHLGGSLQGWEEGSRGAGQVIKLLMDMCSLVGHPAGCICH